MKNIIQRYKQKIGCDIPEKLLNHLQEIGVDIYDEKILDELLINDKGYIKQNINDIIPLFKDDEPTNKSILKLKIEKTNNNKLKLITTK